MFEWETSWSYVCVLSAVVCPLHHNGAIYAEHRRDMTGQVTIECSMANELWKEHGKGELWFYNSTIHVQFCSKRIWRRFLEKE